VRRSPIAGAWYPSNPDVLRSEIDGYLNSARVKSLPGEVIGLIAPHAGYFYSGATAGYAYRCVRGMSFDTCAVFSPLHDYMPNDFLTTAHEAYATPLGQIPVEHSLVDACAHSIESSIGITLHHISNDREHSLEIQLPSCSRRFLPPSLFCRSWCARTIPFYSKQPPGLARRFCGVKISFLLPALTLPFYNEKKQMLSTQRCSNI